MSDESSVPDRIVKTAVLRAPRERVWSAIGDSVQFGRWFGCRIAGPFVAGEEVAAHITEPEEFADQPFRLAVVAVEPGRRLAFRWHVHGVAPESPFAPDCSTLVELVVEDADGGTRLTIVESGFAQVLPEYRSRTFRSNEGGWAHQLQNVARHVGG